MTDEVAKPPVKTLVSALQAKLSRSVRHFSKTATSPAKKSTRSTLPTSPVQQSVSRLTLSEDRASSKLADRLRTEAVPAVQSSQVTHQSSSFTRNKWVVKQQTNATVGNTSAPAIKLNHPVTSGPTFARQIMDRLSHQNHNHQSAGTRGSRSSTGPTRNLHVTRESIQPGKSEFKVPPKAGQLRRQTAPHASAVMPRVALDTVSRSSTMPQPSWTRDSNDISINEHPQQQHEQISFAARLQNAVSSVPPSDNSAAERAVNRVQEVAGWDDFFNAEAGQRSHQDNRSVAENAEISSPESNEPRVPHQSDLQPVGMLAANQFAGWDKTIQGIADARTNNKPKQPLRRIR